MTGNPLVAPEQDSTQWHTGIFIAESVRDLVQGIQSGDWVDIGLGGLTTGLEALSIVMDPIGSVASHLVSFIIEHVEPLQDALDKLAGNADAVAAQTWKNVATALGQVQGDYGLEASADTAGWTGMGSAVEMAGMVVGVVRETVRDLIADLVGRLVVWAAEALTIIGAPAAAAQAAAAAAKWAARIAQIIKQLVRTLQNLMPLLRRLGELFGQIRKKMDDLHAKGGYGDKPPDDPKSHRIPPAVVATTPSPPVTRTRTPSRAGAPLASPTTRPPRTSCRCNGRTNRPRRWRGRATTSNRTRPSPVTRIPTTASRGRSSTTTHPAAITPATSPTASSARSSMARPSGSCST